MEKNMFLKKSLSLKLFLNLLVFFCLCFPSNNFVLAQDKTLITQRAEATELIKQNRYLDALPVLEKIILSYPNDAELWANFGIAIMINSVTLESPEARKEEQERGRKALIKAKQLGTENVKALNILDQFPVNDGNDNFIDENPEAEKALREGEAFFGRGEYEKAFSSYEKAYKINPKSYEAVLFMGDSLYAQRKYKESEVWFAKAVEIDPNREMAYRYWGDALLYQKKYNEAREKFVEAMIADPYSRMSWDSFERWSGESGNPISLPNITPPGNKIAGEIIINENFLKADDGTSNWKLYNDTRKAQTLAKAGKNQPLTLAEETAAWRKVADAARKDIKAGKLKYPDQSLVNLVKIDDDGFLEAYILLLRTREDFIKEYYDYRNKNREKLRGFITKYFLK